MATWKNNEFKLGINMAGAVSAGAYTAGVLDFLMEALEEWQKAKDAFRAYLANPAGPPAAAVPLHEVTIEAFGGASAGGMCAAIAAVMVQQDFAHVRTALEIGTTNTFYESWVNQIDIRHLLDTTDVANGQEVVSLLDSTIIDSIASSALTPKTAVQKPYISEHLTLLLTLTNVRGTPYRLYSDPASNQTAADPTLDEFTAYYGDKLRFETTLGNSVPLADGAKPLPAGTPGAGAWPLLEEAAKATGAFPVMLAPRTLTREKGDYRQPPWQTICDDPGGTPPNPILPAQPATWETLNVDGGVTDNNPFQLVNDVLLSYQNPKPANCDNPSQATEANCAVVTVAPFPATEKFDPDFNVNAASRIWTMLPRLLDVLLSQSRFLGESLNQLTSGISFNRFVIAPSDPKQAQGSALQCGLLSAFGGFFYRGFRRHDFLLGRRNCQRFLRAHFCLPVSNRVIAAGLAETDTHASEIQRDFKVDAPNSQVHPEQVWIPVIPVLGTADATVALPAREVMSVADLNNIVDLIVKRAKAIKPKLLADAPSFVKWLAGIALQWPFSIPIKNAIRTALRDRLGENAAGK